MTQQTPATITALKTFTEETTKLVDLAKKVAATKDESAVIAAQATLDKTIPEVEKALESNA
jgi:hypothetical protein